MAGSAVVRKQIFTGRVYKLHELSISGHIFIRHGRHFIEILLLKSFLFIHLMHELGAHIPVGSFFNLFAINSFGCVTNAIQARNTCCEVFANRPSWVKHPIDNSKGKGDIEAPNPPGWEWVIQFLQITIPGMACSGRDKFLFVAHILPNACSCLEQITYHHPMEYFCSLQALARALCYRIDKSIRRKTW